MVWERKHVEFIHEEEVPWQPFELIGQGLTKGVEVRVLSIDNSDGACTCVVRIPAGWRHSEAFVTDAPEQLFILSGDLHKGEYVYTESNYCYRPAGAEHGPMWSENGCTMLAMWDKAFDVKPGTGSTEGIIGQIDTIKTNWMPTIAEGPQAGIMIKILRHVADTGEMTFLAGILPNWTEPRREHHDCVEESYKLTGDMNLNMTKGERLLMTDHCYFYRPPYRKHGPMYTRSGTMSLIRVSSTLINHYEPLDKEIPIEVGAGAGL